MSSVIRPFFFNLQTTAATPVNTIRTTYNSLKSNPELGKLLTKQVALRTLGVCTAALAAYCSYQSMSAWNVSPVVPNPVFDPPVKPEAAPTFPIVTVSAELNVSAEKVMPFNSMPKCPEGVFKTEALLPVVPSAPEALDSVVTGQPFVSERQSQPFAGASKAYCNASFVSPNFADSIKHSQPMFKTEFSQPKTKTEQYEEVNDGPDDEIHFNESVRVCAAPAPAAPKKYVPVTVEEHIQRKRQSESFTQPFQGFCDDFENPPKKFIQYEFPFQKVQVNPEPVNHNRDETSFPSQDSDADAPDFASTVTKTCIAATILVGTYAMFQLNKWLKSQANEALVDANSSPIPETVQLNESKQEVLQNIEVVDQPANTTVTEFQEITVTKDRVPHINLQSSSVENKCVEDSSSADNQLLQSSENKRPPEEDEQIKTKSKKNSSFTALNRPPKDENCIVLNKKWKNLDGENNPDGSSKQPVNKNPIVQKKVQTNTQGNQPSNNYNTPPRPTSELPTDLSNLGVIRFELPSKKKQSIKNTSVGNNANGANSTAIVMLNTNKTNQETFVEESRNEDVSQQLNQDITNRAKAQLPSMSLLLESQDQRTELNSLTPCSQNESLANKKQPTGSLMPMNPSTKNEQPSRSPFSKNLQSKSKDNDQEQQQLSPMSENKKRVKTSEDAGWVTSEGKRSFKPNRNSPSNKGQLSPFSSNAESFNSVKDSPAKFDLNGNGQGSDIF